MPAAVFLHKREVVHKKNDFALTFPGKSCIVEMERNRKEVLL